MQDVRTRRQEANAVCFLSSMKAKLNILALKTITTNHGAQLLTITTKTSFGTIAMVLATLKHYWIFFEEVTKIF